MISIIIWILSLTFPISAPLQEQTGAIEVGVNNFNNNKGQLGVLVFNKDDGYPEDFKKALHSMLIPIEKDTMIVTIEDLPFGEYVITVLHDENNNDKMDKNFFGKPKEGYGVSNDPKPGKFGPPKYEKGIIELSSPLTTITINLRY